VSAFEYSAAEGGDAGANQASSRNGGVNEQPPYSSGKSAGGLTDSPLQLARLRTVGTRA
jgi:hypothetical protein